MARDNNRYTLTRWQRLRVGILYGMCRFVAILPRWVRYYLLEELIYFVLRYVMRYRRGVIMTNLRNSFPTKNEKELKAIAKRYYNYLAEQFINTLSVTGASPKRMKQYLTFPDAEKYREAVKDTDVILMGGHYGSWEYFTAVALYDPDHVIMSIYHPLHSCVIDDLFKRMRCLENTVLVPRDESLRYFLKNRGGDKRLAMGLIADQNPFFHRDVHWFKFLNQDTIFAEGGEQLARKLSLPVWFGGMRRRRRGEYEMYMEQLYDGREPVEEHEITERYVRRMEQAIEECPELWLWSHRRWKYKPSDQQKREA